MRSTRGGHLSNRWAAPGSERSACRCARHNELRAVNRRPLRTPPGATIRLIAAPVFLGTKLEAFQGRGADDHLASHDLEDVLTVVEGREELIAEAHIAPLELKAYPSERFSARLATPDLIQAIPGHLPGDQSRA
jgi:hypothetical protein